MRVLFCLFLCLSLGPLALKAQCDRHIAMVVKKLEKGDDRTKAAYLFDWITANISYDVPFYLSTYTVDQFKQKQEVCQVFHTKKAVCEGYAQLFKRMATEMGLQAEVIKGYSKQYGERYLDWERSMHSWNAVKIDGKWELIDPTWGSGHLEGQQFVAEQNEKYFLVEPEQLRETHMPLDPMWQLTEKPISFDSFRDANNQTIYLQNFNCLDTLQAFEQLDSLEKKRTSLRRQIAFNPRNGYAYFNLGVLEYNRGKVLLAQYESELDQSFNAGRLYEKYNDYEAELLDILGSFKTSKELIDQTLALKRYTNFGSNELNIREISAFQEVLMGFHQANLKFKVGYDALKRFDNLFNQARTVEDLKSQKEEMNNWLEEAERFFKETSKDAGAIDTKQLKPEVQNVVQQLEQAAEGNLGLIEERRNSLEKYTG